MQYSEAQIQSVKSQLFSLVDKEIELARRTNTLDELLVKYDISLEDSVFPQPVDRRMVILVIGDLSGKINDYKKAAKEYNIQEENLEFVGYEEIKNYNIEKLKYSQRYSDIIVGPMPHKINQIGESSSFISMLENAPDKEAYPKLIEVISDSIDGKPRFSITSFKKALRETKLIHETLLN